MVAILVLLTVVGFLLVDWVQQTLATRRQVVRSPRR